MQFNEFTLRILICFGLSFLIGLERQYRERPVGLRTSILVCIGAFLYVSFSFLVGSNDISRIAAQVVTGIGFLGAGVILKDGAKVKGLTTAATLWCVSAIGVLCAGGALKEAVFGTLLILFSNTLLRYINALVRNITEAKRIHELYEFNITAKETDVAKIKSTFMEFLASNKSFVEFVSYETKDILGGTNLSIRLNISKVKLVLINNLMEILDKKYKSLDYEVKKIIEKDTDNDDEEL